MHPDAIFFSTLKEDRGWYFVEYMPFSNALGRASLTLTVMEPTESGRVATAMESELKRWLVRYPVLLMVTACDDAGESFDLTSVRDGDFLIGHVVEAGSRVSMSWATTDAPSPILDNTQLKALYADIPFKTGADRQREVLRQARSVRIGWWIVFLYAVVWPITVYVVGWFSPLWLSILASSFGLWKACIKACELLGWKEKSRSQIKKDDEELRKRHHHYHCEQNPDGFLRLKVENYDRWAREDNLKEAESLKSTKPKNNMDAQP